MSYGVKPQLPPREEYTAQLERRVAELEDCLEQMAPFGECWRVSTQVKMMAPTKELAELAGWSFKRDTLHFDYRIFRLAKKLLANRVIPNPADVIDYVGDGSPCP